MTKGDQGRYTVPGLKRGLDVLRAFTRETPELSAPDLVDRLGLPRSTVFRILQTLESDGCLIRTEDDRKYRLSVGMLRLGFEYLASQSVVELGRPILDQLSRDVGLSSHLVIRDEEQVVYVLSFKPRISLVGTVTVGTRLPAHATVFGRVLLGGSSPEDLDRIFASGPLKASTRQTPGNLHDLHALVEKDLLQGFGVSEGFYEPNISTVAVPVRNHDGQIIAAAGLTVSAPQLSLELVEQDILERVIVAAKELASSIGYRGTLYQQAMANARDVKNEWIKEKSAS